MIQKKTQLSLSYGNAMILMDWLKEIQIKEWNPRNSFRLVVHATAMKTIERLHDKELMHRDKVQIKLPYAEAIALQILLCTRAWPADALGHGALFFTQRQLPTLPDYETHNLTPENLVGLGESK